MPHTLNHTDTALVRKLEEMARRHDEIAQQLNDPAVLANQSALVPLAREQGQLAPVVETFRAYQKVVRTIEELDQMLDDPDREVRELAELELPEAEQSAHRILDELKDEFLAAEDAGVNSFFLEIRAGTGGAEAALFARDLFEMYRRYCEQKGYRFVVSDFSDADHGGLKEVIVNIQGAGAWRHLRFEGGGHRVQRVPETESQGRIHTSLATVAVLPELPDVTIHIDHKDVEEFGCRGGGPGGQNVNKVETGWMIKHKPSGLIFKMTEHKSQAQNKERAWALLRATLYEQEQSRQNAAERASRKAMMGSGDRSQRVRTYNFPQNRCTDHRLGGEGGGEKNFNLDQILQGHLDDLINALLELDKQHRLANL